MVVFILQVAKEGRQRFFTAFCFLENVAILFLGTGFGLMWFADTLASFPFYMGSIAVWTIGEILYVPASATAVALFSPDQQRGLYQGMARTSWGLSACLGLLLGGIILQRWGPAALWVGVLGLGE